MAMEGSSTLCNAVIMSKPKAPFLRRWMAAYSGFSDADWSGASMAKPHSLWRNGDPDISVLDDHAWFYPKWDTRNYGLMTLWLGKSWWDIDRSYGVHFIHWQHSKKGEWHLRLDPDLVRSIDTPLFCKIRHFFDNLDGDGHFSVPAASNPNCSIAWMSTTANHPTGLLANYDFYHDDDDRKWIDSSGNNLHGWAPNGTRLHRDPLTGTTERTFDQGSWAALPVPADWDARVGAVSVIIKLDSQAWHSRPSPPPSWNRPASWWPKRTSAWVIWKLRVGKRGAIDLSLEPSHHVEQSPTIRFRWTRSAADDVSWGHSLDWKISDKRYAIHRILMPNQGVLSSPPPFPRAIALASADALTSLAKLLDARQHSLVLSWDRVEQQIITLSLDDSLIAAASVDAFHRPLIGKELWINARDWETTDSGFRGSFLGLATYSRADTLTDPLENHMASAQHQSLRSFALLPRGDLARFLLLTIPSATAIVCLSRRRRRQMCAFPRCL
jgi:hypothetical protein